MTSKAPFAPVAIPQVTGVAYVPGNLLLGTDGNKTLGTYLIGSNGMTLYTYAPDAPGVSNCIGQCAVNWPPYTVSDTSALKNLQAGVTGTAGTNTRADGTLQVTYNGKPLYFFKSDVNSGDTNGQGIGGQHPCGLERQPAPNRPE